MLDIAKRNTEGLLALNDYTAKYGLTLDDKALALVLGRRDAALAEQGRVEFGSEVLKKLILAFADSDFIEQDTYADTMSSLLELFYYFKGEAGELISDVELAELMRSKFDKYEGDLEYMSGSSLSSLVRARRLGEDEPEDPLDWDDGDE